jgi:hypothetical protein
MMSYLILVCHYPCTAIQKSGQLSLFIIPLFIYQFAYCQAGVWGEPKLLELYNRVHYWREYQEDRLMAYDSLITANQRFQDYLTAWVSQDPRTIQMPFLSLKKEGLDIADSPDGHLRIYSWDTWLGGTMHDFATVIQGKVGDQTLVKALENSYWYSKIYQVQVGDKPFYLCIRHAIWSTKDSFEGIKVFSIENDSLNTEAPLIKTRTAIRNELGFEFDFFSVVDRKERPIQLIQYDDRTKTIFLPVVHEDGRVTNKQIRYQFTGKYFEKVN